MRHAEHLVGIIKKYYEMTMDWEGTKYCGVTMEWDYEECKVLLSMTGYVENALQRFRTYIKPLVIDDQRQKR